MAVATGHTESAVASATYNVRSASLVLSTTSYSASVLATAAAPTFEFTVSFSTATPTATEFYVQKSYTTNGIETVTASGASGHYTVQLKSPASFVAGTYGDTVTIMGCYDKACAQPVSKSPQQISVSYTVLPPELTSLSPSNTPVYTAFTLMVNGAGFTPNDVVSLNGNQMPTTFISGTQVTASVSAATIGQTGRYLVSVSNSPNFGSNWLTLNVYSEAILTGISPRSAVAGSPPFTMTLTGAYFTQSSVVHLGGTPLPTSFAYESNQITATVSPSNILNAGTVPVTVAEGSAVSNALPFTIQPLPPLRLGSVNPSIVVAGAAGFILTALGEGFTPAAMIRWNGIALPTTYVSSLQLQAQVPASDIAVIGTASITVQNVGTVGGISSALPLSIQNAAPDAVALQISPNHAGAITFNSVTFPTMSTWSVDVGGTPSYALIADGKVIVTVKIGISDTSGSTLIALDQATGKTVWGPVQLAGNANAAYDGGKVYVLSDLPPNFGTLQSYDIATGSLDWTTTLTESYDFESPPTASNGFVYTGVNEEMFAVSEEAGAFEWGQTVFGGDWGAPAVTSEGVYVSYPCQTYGFQPSTGSILFHDSTGCDGGGGATPVVANNVFYAGAGGGATNDYGGSIVNATTGAQLGAFNADVAPAIGASTGFFLQSGTLNAISLSDYKTVLWSFTGDGSLVTSPIIVNQAVIIASSSGNVYALNATTGQQLWSINAGAAIPSSIPMMPASALAAGDGLLIVPAGNRVVAYTLSTSP